MANHNTQARKVQALDRQLQALELRKAGLPYRTIADRLGYKSVASAHRAVQKALQSTLAEAAEPLRALEAERLDKLLFAVWRQAMDGNQGAIDRVLRVMERRAKMFGLDAPTRTEVTGREGGPVQVETLNLSDDERADRLAALLDAARARRDGRAAGDGVLARSAPEPETA